MPPRDALQIRGRTVQSGYDLLRTMGQATQAGGESISRAAALERLRQMDRVRLQLEREGMEREFQRAEAKKILAEMQARTALDAQEGKPLDPKIHDATVYRLNYPIYLDKLAHSEVAAIPEDAIANYKPPTKAHEDAWIRRLGVMSAQGALAEKDKEKQEKADFMKSVAAATSLKELDRLAPLDNPSSMVLERRRKVLKEEQDFRLGAALGDYSGDINGLPDYLKEKEVEFDDADLSRAQEIVFRRQSYNRAVKDMEAAEENRKAGKLQDAAVGYARSAATLNAQIDDIEKKGWIEERNIVTGAITRTFDQSRLSGEDQTLLTRLKTERLRAVDAVTGLAAADPAALLGGMSEEQKRALGEALLREMGGK